MKSMDKKCAMDESLVMVLVTLELAAANVVNPSPEAREVAFRHLSIVSLHFSIFYVKFKPSRIARILAFSTLVQPAVAPTQPHHLYDLSEALWEFG
ncbi:hypothetical protein J1N35_017688 [Gossypium stocksii]|uniref:Uncharacterized protein n=1 Tax=Gossypium stocksii TaxID=47602 RepID=A0A9D4A6G0_9ROSI|nr:hypothetical protein J1N35_017688 [Gossypium stocksii]